MYRANGAMLLVVFNQFNDHDTLTTRRMFHPHDARPDLPTPPLRYHRGRAVS